MSKKTTILFVFVLAKFILQYLLISSEYDLQRDEFLHLDQTHHLAWGYLSVPPVTSWISTIIYLLGNSVFWVKFFPGLFGALTIVVVWKAIEELNGNLFALILGATCVLFSSLLRLNLLYQPNSLDVLCWATFYLIIIKYIKTEESKWMFAAALIFAIGLLNKYNFVFLIMGLFPALLITEQRKMLLKKSFYLAVFLGLILIIPNLLWQYNNNFPVFHHLKLLADTQLVHVSRWIFLKEQVFFFIGSVFVIVAGLYALLFYAPFQKFRFFFWSLAFTLLIFIYLRAKGYYAIGLYPIYISFGSVYISHLLSTGWKRNLQPIAIAIPVLFFIPMYQVAFPNKSPEYIVQNPEVYKELGMLRWEDGEEHHLPQDFADMLGWKELAEKVDEAFATLPNPEQTLILCDNYGQAGAINYYSKNKKVRADSFNADYINWLNLNRNIVDVILVKEADDEDPERLVEIPLFDTVFLADQRINEFAREQKISIYILRGAKVDVNQRLREERDRKMF